MTLLDLLWLPPVLLAMAAVVGTAGRPEEDLGRHVRRTFLALLGGVVAVGIVVRALVMLFT